MVLQNLDRTQWTFAEAYAHVATVVIAHRTVEANKLPPEPLREYRPWERPEDPRKKWKAEALEQLLVALRDGDLFAQGRYSNTRNNRNWGPDYGKEWILHSGHHQLIAPEQWKQGQRIKDGLSTLKWEFIDIRMPRFMVMAIWPDYVPPADVADVKEAADGPDYWPPYLDLMEEAIAYFHLSDANQEKKEALVEWFRAHRVEGAQISGNLAGSMATLVRLPSAQKGGAKRSWAG